MGNRRNVIFAAGLVVLGLAGGVWFLTGEGLDRAEKWVSLVGVFLSAVLGGAGVVLGWATWRHTVRTAPLPGSTTASGAPAADGPSPVPPPGGVVASGPASVAVGESNTGTITTRYDGTPPRTRRRNTRRRPDGTPLGGKDE